MSVYLEIIIAVSFVTALGSLVYAGFVFKNNMIKTLDLIAETNSRAQKSDDDTQKPVDSAQEQKPSLAAPEPSDRFREHVRHTREIAKDRLSGEAYKISLLGAAAIIRNAVRMFKSQADVENYLCSPNGKFGYLTPLEMAAHGRHEEVIEQQKYKTGGSFFAVKTPNPVRGNKGTLTIADLEFEDEENSDEKLLH